MARAVDEDELIEHSTLVGEELKLLSGKRGPDEVGVRVMIQDTLARPEWAQVLTDTDRSGLTPLFHSNMTPYGIVRLRPDQRLDLSTQPRPDRVGAS